MASKKTPIIVLGAPRSGTTLLRRLLDAHPNIDCPSETNLLNACGRFLREETISEGVAVGPLTGLGFLDVEPDQVYAHLRDLCAGFHEDHMKRQGKRRWAEKSAMDIFYVAEIEKLFGNHAHFICVQRHALDVVCSLKDLSDANGGYLQELHDYIIRYPRPLVAFAHAWVDLTRSLADFASRHQDRTTYVHYEDLVKDPENTMKTVFEFLEEPWAPDVLENALTRTDSIGLGDWKTYGTQSIQESSTERWRKLSPWTVSELGAIVNDTLEERGYDPVPLKAPVNAETARRRYQFSLMSERLRKV